jgi:hypothetical protein
MGNTQSVQKVNFEDVQKIIKTPEKYLLINTLNITEQRCLIYGTVPITSEVDVINKFMEKKTIYIIIYGKNACDDSVRKKYTQLIELGFSNIYIYPGGMFEWLLLQDVYGNEEFNTTINEIDILKYKGNSELSTLMLRDVT